MAPKTARFNAYVHLADSDNAFHAFAPGDPVPEWARSEVGEHCVAYDDVPVVANPSELTAHARGYDEFADEPDMPMPPTQGPGSSAQAWARYAIHKGDREIDETWSRQAIIDRLVRTGAIAE